MQLTNGAVLVCFAAKRVALGWGLSERWRVGY